MYRSVLSLALMTALFCFFGLVIPQSWSALTFLLPDGALAVVNLFLAVVLLHFGIAEFFRRRWYKVVFGIFGLAWTGFAVMVPLHPTYYGLFAHYIRPANAAVMCIVGLGYLIAALEYDRPGLAKEIGIQTSTYLWRSLLRGSHLHLHAHTKHNSVKIH